MTYIYTDGLCTCTRVHKYGKHAASIQDVCMAPKGQLSSDVHVPRLLLPIIHAANLSFDQILKHVHELLYLHKCTCISRSGQALAAFRRCNQDHPSLAHAAAIAV